MIDLTKLQPHKVSRDLSGYITYIYGPGKIGKAQPIDTIIPTPQGKKLLKDINIGDFVYDKDGKPTKVIGVFPQGKLDNYEVTFSDGRVTYCNNEHLWTYLTSRDNFKTITTQKMIDKGLKENGTKAGYRFKIPTLSAPVEKDEKVFSVDPYVIGAFLGDGCCKERILTISSNDEEIVQNISSLIGASNYKKNSDNNYNWHFTLKDKDVYLNDNNVPVTNFQTKVIFKDFIDEVCTDASNKRIPALYLEGSINQRFALLQGLMDTDGSIEKSTYVLSFNTISKGLALDVLELIHSLGYKASLVLDTRPDKYNNEEGICYQVKPLVPNAEKVKFFNLSRKVKIAKEAANKTIRRKFDRIEITNIEPTGEQVEMKCILVNNPDHLYLTNDYIVTHNTTFGSQMPGALILAFQKGYNALPNVYAQDVTTWADMKIILRDLKKPEVKDLFHSIIVDTIDIAAAACQKYIISQAGVDTLNQIPYGQGWSRVKRQLEDTFREVTQMGYAVLFISHDKDKTFKRQDGTEYNQIVPTLGNSYNLIIKDMVDIYGYAHLTIRDGEPKRILTLRSLDGTIDCGSRFKYMQSEVNFSYDSLVDSLNKAIDEEAKYTGKEFITNERNVSIYSTEVNFDDLYAQCRDLLSSLSKEEEIHYAPYITEITDKYLGKGKKIANITRDQTEQLSLIVFDLKELFKDKQ